jgi:hypothetical protein
MSCRPTGCGRAGYGDRVGPSRSPITVQALVYRTAAAYALTEPAMVRALVADLDTEQWKAVAVTAEGAWGTLFDDAHRSGTLPSAGSIRAEVVRLAEAVPQVSTEIVGILDGYLAGKDPTQDNENPVAFGHLFIALNAVIGSHQSSAEEYARAMHELADELDRKATEDRGGTERRDVG